MTANEFNEKYKDYLEEGHYGLGFDTPLATKWLDEMFEGLVKIPGFKYHQIKLKFGRARFYFITDLPAKLNRIIEDGIEEEINKIV